MVILGTSEVTFSVLKHLKIVGLRREWGGIFGQLS